MYPYEMTRRMTEDTGRFGAGFLLREASVLLSANRQCTGGKDSL